MGFKAPVKAGKRFRVSYAAEASSQGTTLLRVIWVAKHGNSVPEAGLAQIEPGASDVISGTVPSVQACRWLEIWVDLPDGTGKGKLILEVGDQIHSQAVLDADSLWTSLVIG